jgi:hypothetical protein
LAVQAKKLDEDIDRIELNSCCWTSFAAFGERLEFRCVAEIPGDLSQPKLLMML